MTITTSYRNGTGKEAETTAVEHRFEAEFAALPAHETVVGLTGITIEPGASRLRNGTGTHRPDSSSLALVCFENPESPLGQNVARLALALVKRNISVHVFSRRRFEPDVPGVHNHAIGERPDLDLLEQVEEFTRLVYSSFLEQFPGSGGEQILLTGHEWSAVPALELLRADRKQDYLLSLGSMERQRSDMRNDLSQRIEEIELTGLRRAGSVLVQQPGVAEIARYWVPECAGRLVQARQPFPVHLFDSRLDPGVVKARYQIGPVDPTILYLGDMDERHGPDVLMKSVPPILKNHKQARFVFVGEGSLWWPLRVHARYLLLEHAVRLVGHVEGQRLFDLIEAADIVVVPSREQSEWWPIQAAWAARRPVVAAHPIGDMLIAHEQDGVLVYPHESSLVWGIERLLFDEDLRRRVGARGHEKLEECFGWNSVAEQVEELLRLPQTVN